MASELCFPISLLRAPDTELECLVVAWANDSHGRGLIAADSKAIGDGLDVFQDIEDADWFAALDKKTQESILENTNEDAAAWAANRARMPKDRRGFEHLADHLYWLKKARKTDQQACTKSQSPTVYLPPMAMQRAFKDPADRRDLAIRDFRNLCSLYSWIGCEPARVVRRSAILKRAFGFWSDDHDEAKVESHIRKMQGFDFTVKMIRDSLHRLDKCGEIIRLKASPRNTWYARGSTPIEKVLKRIDQSKPSRSRSTAVQALFDQRRQEQNAFASMRKAIPEQGSARSHKGGQSQDHKGGHYNDSLGMNPSE